MNKSLIRSGTRRAIALTTYRGLLNVALLVALFHAFPDHQMVSILAVLAFSQGIAGIGMALSQIAVVQSAMVDASERKTRHTILLAANPEWGQEFEFWTEVNRRVAAEEEADDPPPWWAQVGLTITSFAGLLVSDLISIALALFVAGATAS